MILSIDLGNEYGWAIKKHSTIESGWERLTNGSKNHTGKKFELFRLWLEEFDEIDLKEIWFEDIGWNSGLSAARAYCGYVAVLQMYAYRRGIPCFGVAVKTIKKYWTGNGNADKQLMVDESRSRGFEDVDNDNEADALALLHYVMAK